MKHVPGFRTCLICCTLKEIFLHRDIYFLILSSAFIKNNHKILICCQKLLCQHILLISCLEWKTHAFLESNDSGPIKFLATNVSLQYTAESLFFFNSPAKLNNIGYTVKQKAFRKSLKNVIRPVCRGMAMWMHAPPPPNQLGSLFQNHAIFHQKLSLHPYNFGLALKSKLS